MDDVDINKIIVLKKVSGSLVTEMVKKVLLLCIMIP